MKQVGNSLIMEGNVHIISNASQESVMKIPMHVKEEGKEKRAMIIASVIETLLVDLVSSGLMKHNVFQWVTLIPDAKQIMIANQETSAGVN